MGSSTRVRSSPQDHSPPETILLSQSSLKPNANSEYVHSGEPPRRTSLPAQGSIQGPAQGHLQPPAQGQSQLPAQGPSQPPVQGTGRSSSTGWDYTFHTLNVNAWSTFKSKLDDTNFMESVGYSTILFIQEHKLVSTDELDAAIAHCAQRGFTAVFSPALTLASGKPSGGVGILISEGLNIGITRVAYDFSESAHRLVSVSRSPRSRSAYSHVPLL